MAKLEKIQSKNECNKKIERQKIDELTGMQLHGQFGRETEASYQLPRNT